MRHNLDLHAWQARNGWTVLDMESGSATWVAECATRDMLDALVSGLRAGRQCVAVTLHPSEVS